MKHFLSVHDVPSIASLVGDAMRYKSNPLTDHALGKGKNIGLIFFNPSLRTRISTQRAARNLGMDVIVFNIGEEGWALEFGDNVVMNGSRPEHIRDAAPVLGSYFDILAVRTFPTLTDKADDYSEQFLNQFVKHCGIPIVSMESATLHPLQSAADILTIAESWKQPEKPNIVLTWAPHIKPLPHCVANSFAQWVNHWGEANFTIAHPAGYALEDTFVKNAATTEDQMEALQGADFVYVKNWCAISDYGTMPNVEGDWMLNNEKLKVTNHAKVMHCLPVRRDVELSSAILDGSDSLVSQQAANRLWATQAVISALLKSM